MTRERLDATALTLDGRPMAAAHWSGDAVPEQVARHRTAASTFAGRFGAPDALVDDVRLAVSEALSNVIMHAYPDDPGRLDTRATADPTAGLVTVSIRDYGIGFRPRPDSPGIGMGVPIMTALAHDRDRDSRNRRHRSASHLRRPAGGQAHLASTPVAVGAKPLLPADREQRACAWPRGVGSSG